MGCSARRSVVVSENQESKGDVYYDKREYSEAFIHYKYELTDLKGKNLPLSSVLLTKILVCLDHVASPEERISHYKTLENLLSSQKEQTFDSAESITLHNKIADQLFLIENYSEAINYLETIKKATGKSENPCKDLVKINNRLALCHKFLGNFEEALKIFKKNIEAAAEVNKEQLAVAYGNTGCCYLTIGDLETASEYLQKSLEIKKEFKEADLTGIYNNLAVLSFNKNDWENSLDYIEKALSRIGKNEKLKAKILNNKAACLFKIKGSEAQTAFEESQQAFAVIKDQASQAQTFAFYNNVLIYLKKSGRDQEFKGKLVQFQKLYERAEVGTFNYGLVLASNSLFLYYSKNFERALDEILKAVEVRKKYFKENSVFWVNTYNNIGALYMILGKQDEADQYFDRAMNIH